MNRSSGRWEPSAFQSPCSQTASYCRPDDSAFGSPAKRRNRTLSVSSRPSSDGWISFSRRT